MKPFAEINTVLSSTCRLVVPLLLCCVFVTACGKRESVKDAEGSGTQAGEAVEQATLTVYSHRHYAADQQLFEAFTKETGIHVDVVKAKSDELIKRIEAEGDETPADILITADAGRLVQATDKGLLAQTQSADLDALVPANLRDRDGYWFALTVRARIIAYAKDRVKPDDIKTYAELADPKWKKKVLVRSSANIYNRSLMASLIENLGAEKAEAWAKGVVANFARAPKGNDRDQMKGVVAGLGDLAIVNTYYLGLLLNSSNPEEVKVGEKIGIIFPDQDANGAHINISGGGITKASKNKEAAVKLLAFLVSDASQKVFSAENHEFPIRETVPASDLLKSWGTFKRDELNLSVLGKRNAEATEVFANANWP